MYEIFLKLLKERGVKASDVAKATGIPQSTFSDWKNGRSKPKDEKLQKIANYFGVSTYYLRTGKKPYTLEFNADDLQKALNKSMAEKYGDENIEQQDYYIDSETEKIMEAMATNPKLRALYFAQSDLDPNVIQAFYDMVIAMKQKEERLDSDDPA